MIFMCVFCHPRSMGIKRTDFKKERSIQAGEELLAKRRCLDGTGLFNQSLPGVFTDVGRCLNVVAAALTRLTHPFSSSLASMGIVRIRLPMAA